MKKICTLLMVAAVASSAIFAQGIKTEMLYQKYKGEEGVISVWIPGFAMRLVSGLADLEADEEAFLNSIRSLRVLTIENKGLYPETNFVKEAGIEGAIKGYEMLIEIHDGGEDITIMGREKNGKLKDMLVLVGGEDNVMVHIKGRMNADIIGSAARIAGIDSNIVLTSL